MLDDFRHLFLIILPIVIAKKSLVILALFFIRHHSNQFDMKRIDCLYAICIHILCEAFHIPKYKQIDVLHVLS